MSDQPAPLNARSAAPPWQAILADAGSARQQVARLLGDPAAAERVPELPPEFLYYLVKAVGVVDASDLLPLATPEQIQTCLDFDLWDRDDVADDRALEWLEVLVELPLGRLAAVVRTLDSELLAFLLARHLRVREREPEEAAPSEPGPRAVETPDRLFTIEYTRQSPPLAHALWHLLEMLYRADADLARHLLLEAAAGLQSELRETAYHWRSCRMADLGFPDYYDALEVYRYLDPRAVAPPASGAPRRLPGPAEPVALPLPFAQSFAADTFLGRALARIDDAATVEELAGRLVVLMNRVLVADRVDVTDLEAVRTCAERVRDTLSLGLEHLADGDLDRAAAALTARPLVDIFRVGHSLTVDLHRRAARLHASGVTHPDLDPLLSPRPEMPRSLDVPPTAGTRPFRTRADLERVAALLATLEHSPEAP